MRLVLLPGLDGTGRLFDRLEHALRGRIECLRMSYREVDRAGYEQFVDDVLSHIGSRPCVILGESFSGPIAVEVATRAPQQVCGLILAATFLRAPLPPWIIRTGARLDHSRIPFPIIRYAMMGRNADEATARDLAGVVKELPTLTVRQRLIAVAGSDVTGMVRTINCPILALHGRNDWIVPASTVSSGLKNMPNATVKLVPGPHMLLQCKAPEMAELIVEFVDGLGSLHS